MSAGAGRASGKAGAAEAADPAAPPAPPRAALPVIVGEFKVTVVPKK